MNAPERVLKTINHEEPDKVPYFESAFTNNTIAKHFGVNAGNPMAALSLLKYVPFKNKILTGVLNKKSLVKKGLRATYEMSKKIGIDLVMSITSIFPRQYLKDEKTKAPGFIDEYGRVMRAEFYEKDGTVILGYVKGHFESFEDYESWEQTDPNLKARVVGFKAGRELQEEMNNEVFSIPSSGSLMECTWEGFGIEKFSRILAKRKQAKRIFDDRGKFTLELVKILSEQDAQMILLFDDFGYKNGLFMSPKNFRDFVFPWYNKICEAAHKNDCKILLHSDGDLTMIFEDIVKSGVDALNPIEPTTANPDYDIFKLNQKYGDQITFVGNVSPQMLSTGTIPEIEGYSKRLIQEIAPGGGYIFSSGHSINPAVTVDRYLAMLKIKEKYGIYPINGKN